MVQIHSPEMVSRQFVFAIDRHGLHLRRACDGRHRVLGDYNAQNISWVDGRRPSGADLFSINVSMRLQTYQSFCFACTILDLVLSPRMSNAECIDYLPPLRTSDHSTIMVHWRYGVPQSPKAYPGPNVWKAEFEECNM